MRDIAPKEKWLKILDFTHFSRKMLFSQSERKEKIGYISTSRLIDFANHPFKVEENSAFYELIYKKYFASDIFEREKAQKDLEIRINQLLKNGKYSEEKELLGIE